MYGDNLEGFLLQILKRHVDQRRKVVDSIPPSCKIAIHWTGEELPAAKLPVFAREVKLIGAKGPYNNFTLHIIPSGGQLVQYIHVQCSFHEIIVICTFWSV